MNVQELTRDLVAIPSVSRNTNKEVADRSEAALLEAGFSVERLFYIDDTGVEKFNLVGKKGDGDGGLGFFSHNDTVPGDEGWEPYAPRVEDGRLYGRGSCDMKGPLSASIVAASQVNTNDLKHPVFIAVTADEEAGYAGARQISSESATLAAAWPKFAIVCEPSLMTPVYAHKGSTTIVVTAHGVAAHSSTDRGESANFKMAPFLVEMSELAKEFKSNPGYRNGEFDPPTNGFNMVINDGGTAANVTAARSVCTLCFRSMPRSGSEAIEKNILERVTAHGFEVRTYSHGVFYSDRDSLLIRTACELTGHKQAITVPYGTEAVAYQNFAETMVMGPGNIAQAHTVGEYIELDQLDRAVDVYRRLIKKLCQ